MKKILSVVLATVLMLALVACAKPAPTISSTPESTTESQPLRENAYIHAEIIEFEIYDDLIIETSDRGNLVIYFSEAETYPVLTFLPPFAEAATVMIDEEYAKWFVGELWKVNGIVDATIYDIAQITIDNQTVWMVSTDIELNDGFGTYKLTYWVCQPNDGDVVCVWLYSTFENIEEYYARNQHSQTHAQTVINSIRFIY